MKYFFRYSLQREKLSNGNEPRGKTRIVGNTGRGAKERCTRAHCRFLYFYV